MFLGPKKMSCISLIKAVSKLLPMCVGKMVVENPMISMPIMICVQQQGYLLMFINKK